MNPIDERLSREFATRCDEARKMLWAHMADRGLRKQDGWTIQESTRHIDGGTELVMRPLHRQIRAPDDLECRCAIDEPGSNVSSDCDDE